MTNIEIYGRVMGLLNQCGLTVKEAERRIGVANGCLSKWKTSTPTLTTAIKVAEFFHTPVDYLIGTSEPGEELLITYYREADEETRNRVMELLRNSNKKESNEKTNARD